MDFLVLTTPKASGCVAGSTILASTDEVGEAVKRLFVSLAVSSKYGVLKQPDFGINNTF